MTQDTEKDSAEFEAWKEDYALKFEPNYDEHLEADCKAAFLAGMKADRHAPVVPQGWRLVPLEPTQEMKRAGMSERHDDLSRSVYQAMLAAAPQPPEAAPVQMPDALLSLEVDAHYIFNNPPCECPQAVRDVIEWYAGSIRQLLAAHGVK